MSKQILGIDVSRKELVAALLIGVYQCLVFLGKIKY
jgi:hypothetical protein